MIILDLMLLSSLSMAAELYPESATEKDKIAVLRDFFSPQPGKTVLIDKQDMRNYPNRDPLEHRGFITVTPPKDHCINIKRQAHLRDFFICKRKRLPFEAKEVHRDGTIRWFVTTSEKDPGIWLL